MLGYFGVVFLKLHFYLHSNNASEYRTSWVVGCEVSVAHGGTMTTVERDKRTTIIDDGGSDQVSVVISDAGADDDKRRRWWQLLNRRSTGLQRWTWGRMGA